MTMREAVVNDCKTVYGENIYCWSNIKNEMHL